jgi:hypothetical protein
VSVGGRSRRETRAVDPTVILDVLVAHGCRFVVVGSTAQRLLGAAVVPSDLDVVIPDGLDDRRRLVATLIELRAWILDRGRHRRLGPATPLPWDWSWRVHTPWGCVDVIVRFIDGTGYTHHAARAVDTATSNGSPVRCHPTLNAT